MQDTVDTVTNPETVFLRFKMNIGSPAPDSPVYEDIDDLDNRGSGSRLD
jgi:hypothetical protein